MHQRKPAKRARYSATLFLRLAAVAAALLLLLGCASSSARDSVRLSAPRLADSCPPGADSAASPQPWLAEHRPFDAERIDFEAYRQHQRCVVRADRPTGDPASVWPPAESLDVAAFELPRLCGLPLDRNDTGC